MVQGAHAAGVFPRDRPVRVGAVSPAGEDATPAIGADLVTVDPDFDNAQAA